MEIKDTNFEDLIKSKKVVVVDFWASWCGPCKMLSPVIDELSKNYEEKNVLLTKYNVDEENDYCVKYNIRSIPTLLFFKDGVLCDKRLNGIQTSEQICKVIDGLLE